jgi:hypothetical protein
MNKKNMLLTAGLLLSVVTVALPVGKRAKDPVYAMHALDQDFNQSPFIKENIDRLIYLFSMNIKLADKQLQSMSWNMTTVAKSIAAVGEIAIVRAAGSVAMEMIFPRERTIKGSVSEYTSLISSLFFAVGTSVMTAYVALKAYDAFKSKNVLEKSLAVDRAILAKLIELREAMTLQDSIEADEYDQHVELRLI